jgi:ABC-type branched-subunit amino acid transport system substrate-binding protein
MSRRITALLVLLVLVVAAVAWGLTSGSGPTKSGPTKGSSVVQGVIADYSGPSSFEGPVNNAGAYPAVYEINKAGGVLGHLFKVVIVDTRGDPADALPLVEKFLGTQGNIVGMTGPSEVAPQIVPIINKAKITMFSLAGQSSFDRNTFKYFWRLLPPDPANGIAVALWAKRLGYKRIALVFGTDASAQGDLPGVLKGIKDLHLNLVANVSLTPDQPSYQSDVAKLAGAHPQVIVTEEDATSAATFFGEMKSLGLVVPIIGTSGTGISNWVSEVASVMGKGPFAKLLSVVTIKAPVQTAANAAFRDGIDHQASVLQAPLNQWYSEPYSSAAYDGVIISALAMVAAHSVVPSAYNSYITRVTEPGTGKTVVYTFAAGRAALEQGKQIQYVGASGPILLNKWHNSYGDQVAVRYSQGTLASESVVSVIKASEIASVG